MAVFVDHVGGYRPLVPHLLHVLQLELEVGLVLRSPVRWLMIPLDLDAGRVFRPDRLLVLWEGAGERGL